MSLHGDLGSHDECGTVLNWQNGYSDFYAETNKLCKAAGNQNLNSEPLLSHRGYTETSTSYRLQIQSKNSWYWAIYTMFS